MHIYKCYSSSTRRLRRASVRYFDTLVTTTGARRQARHRLPEYGQGKRSATSSASRRHSQTAFFEAKSYDGRECGEPYCILAASFARVEKVAAHRRDRHFCINRQYAKQIASGRSPASAGAPPVLFLFITQYRDLCHGKFEAMNLTFLQPDYPRRTPPVAWFKCCLLEQVKADSSDERRDASISCST